MRLVIAVIPSESGWTVTIRDPILPDVTPQTSLEPTVQPLLPEPRQLRAVTTARAGRFPVPPPEDSPGLAEENRPPPGPLETLCAGSDPDLIATYFRDFVSQSIDLEHTRTFGKYLFRTLIGPAVWQRIRTRLTTGEGLDLILSWAPEHHELTRLPWEILHGEEDFLIAGSGFSLTREMAGATGTLRPMGSPPRVLFVIGSGGGDRHFDGLKPGAEYFGLLRGLRQNGIALNTIPLVGATARRLEAAVERWRPDVVHFICHGHEDGTLDLIDDDNHDERRALNGTELFRHLHPSPTSRNSTGEDTRHTDPYPGPQIVVLNACHSASGGYEVEDAGQAHFPLAVGLVRAGIPVVVGMAGEVADQACRLFTRSFYQSLLSDGRVSCAAARGRRAGLLYGRNDAQRIDWALPTLFVSQSASGARVTVQPDRHEANWHQLAEALSPPCHGYYARLDLLRLFGLLMLDDAEQRKIEDRRTDLQVLGLSSTEKDSDRFGRSSALCDLAAAAARGGDVPVVIEKRLNGRWPVTVEQLISFLMKATRVTLENLGIAPTAPAFGWSVTRLIQGIAPGTRPPPECPLEVANIFSGGDARAEYFDMLAAAVRCDLLSYLQEIRAVRERPGAKLLLLIDDVHLMGDAVMFLFNHLLSTEGLRAYAARPSVRVLFTYSRSSKPNDQSAAITTITDFLSQRTYATDLSLSCFRDPTESQLAYQNFLFHWHEGNNAKPLVPVRTDPTEVERMFASLRKYIRGVPSLLADGQMSFMVDFFLDRAVLRVATDEDALRNTQ